MGCAILGISHFTKGTAGRDPVERVAGSLAFGAFARLVLGVARRKEEKGGKYILTRAKSNLGLDGGGFAYEIEQTETPGQPGMSTARVVWGESLAGSARRILAEEVVAEKDDDRESRMNAMAFLKSLLADGPVPVKQLRADASGAGYAWRTIERAKKALSATAQKGGMNLGWFWSLTPNTAIPEHGRHPQNHGGLREFGGLRAPPTCQEAANADISSEGRQETGMGLYGIASESNPD